MDLTDKIILLEGDCLELMKSVPDKSIDLIFCDLPYGSIKLDWDLRLGLDPLWSQYKRIIKPGRAICLTATQPFASFLIMTNQNWYRHEWIWNKVKPSNFLLSKVMPMMTHESVLIFGDGKVLYNPQMTKGRMRNKTATNKTQFKGGGWGKVSFEGTQKINDQYYPKSILEISNANQKGKIHPTQKPIALVEYFIKTYSNEGDKVLDNCFGSGTTGIACLNTNRRFLGMELDPKYFRLGSERIKEHLVGQNENIIQ